MKERQNEEWRSVMVHTMTGTFRAQRSLAERAIGQLEEPDMFRTLDEEENSIAILMKHVGGNLRSRWSDPFTTDGEKPDRNRDAEFETSGDDDVAAVSRTWDVGWSVLNQTLDALSPGDFERPLTIRGETVTLLDALLRSLAHTAQHVGQITLLARHWRGSAWQTLSIPRPPRGPEGSE
ncbi:DUF1572 domain-containing protein [soil metagenome]